MPTLKDLRAAARLSQAELALASGVSLETIKKIEAGKVERPHPATLRQLAAVLGQVPATLHSSRDGRVFDPGMVDNARRNGVPVLAILPDAERQVLPGFVPLRQTTLSGAIDGPLAALKLTQVFGYLSADCDQVLEAVYRFPLPGDAAVTGLVVRFGGVTVATSLVPRAEAEAQYQAARQEGRQAAVSARESPDVLTLQLTGLQPDQDVTIETTFAQAAVPDGPGWELRLPLTIGPRYSRPDEQGTPGARGQPLAVWHDPGHRFTLDLVVRAAATITSPSHALEVLAEPDGAERVRLRDGSVLPDRDLVLAWRPEQAGDRPALEVLVHEEAQEGTRYFLALVSPPAGAGALPVIDREITLLVDHSGSMAGPKWQACRWAVRRFLAGLRPTDTFHLGLFQSTCAWLAPGPLSGTGATRERALRFLEAHVPDGGTELGPALEQALRRPRSPGERARHVLLLTDAQVSDEGRLLQLVETEAARPDDGRRLSLLCIDAAPKSAFVRDLAEAGGGVAVFLSSDPHQEDITAALDRVLDAWAQPLAKDVQLVVETRAEARTAHGGAGCTRSATRLGDLPAGRSLWASGAVSLFSEPVFRLCAGASVLAEVALDLASPPPPRPELRTLFGARQIARLERLAAGRYDAVERDAVLDALGYAGDPLRAPEPPPLYAENAARVQNAVVQRLLERESLRFGLICSATAFVGVRTEAGRRVDATVLVPSALPAGWSDRFLGQSSPPQARAALPRRARLPAPVPADYGPQARPVSPRVAETVSSQGPLEEVLSFGDGVLRFHGTPVVGQDTAVLAEGVAGSDLPFFPTYLRAALEEGDASAVDELTEIWVCVGQPTTPVVRVRLRELLALGGERPLNLELSRGERVWLLLHAPPGSWPAAAGHLSIELG